jgi:hypothetical protein
MVYEPLHKQGQPDITRPAVICEWCGREIETAEHGMYLFDARLENEAYWRSEPVELTRSTKSTCTAVGAASWPPKAGMKGW